MLFSPDVLGVRILVIGTMDIDPNNLQCNDEPLARDDADLLISRAVDGRSSDSEWASLEAAAETDPLVWRRLAHAHRDQALLVKGVARAVGVAEHVELPTRLEAERLDTERLAGGGSSLSGVRAWGGWAAAAVLVLALVLRTNKDVTPVVSQQPVIKPAEAGLLSSADAFRAYLDKGKQEGLVLGEVPDHVLVESRPVENGSGFEVVYVRQVLERARVADLYRFSHDEAGRALPVRVQGRSAQGSVPTVY